MATPEQNTLLALQLFAPAGDIAQRMAAQHRSENAQRVELLTHLFDLQNQERVQTQQFDRQQSAATNLERLRQRNAVELNDKTTQRQLEVSEQAQSASDKRELDRQFSLSYPVYAQSATALGETVKAVTEYTRDWAGLGQLQGDMAALKERAGKKEKGDAAKGLIAILDQSMKELKNAIDARDEVNKIGADDIAAARGMGLSALRRAADTGVIDIDKKKLSTALTALDKDQPDYTVAQQILGPTGISVYTAGVQAGVQQLSNDKERLARIAAASRDVQAAQRGSSDALLRLMQIAATNPELGSLLQERTRKLNALENAPAAASGPDTQAIFRRLIGAPPPKPIGAGVAAPQAPAAPSWRNPSAFMPAAINPFMPISQSNPLPLQQPRLQGDQQMPSRLDMNRLRSLLSNQGAPNPLMVDPNLFNDAIDIQAEPVLDGAP